MECSSSAVTPDECHGPQQASTAWSVVPQRCSLPRVFRTVPLSSSVPAVSRAACWDSRFVSSRTRPQSRRQTGTSADKEAGIGLYKIYSYIVTLHSTNNRYRKHKSNMLAVNEAIRCTGSSHLTKSTESVALWQQNNQNDNCGYSYNGEEKKKKSSVDDGVWPCILKHCVNSSVPRTRLPL